MSQSVHVPRWSWVAGIGLGLAVVAVICVLLISHNRASLNSTVLETSEPSTTVSSSTPTIEPEVVVVDTPLQLPRLDFPQGSVEEACGFNELPTYSIAGSYDTIIQKNGDRAQALETDECRIALEAHMSATNPQLFLSSAPNFASLAELVVLDEPFTFERIFADPSGDLLRVQDALSRPECLLTGDETNWELKETCHADALLNYAFVNLFCFSEGIENRLPPVDRGKNYSNPYRKHPTPQEDRILWKQDLEDSWLVSKCAVLDPTLELTVGHYPELHTLVMSWHEKEITPFSKGVEALLVELAARLGDDAAGLSHTVFEPHHMGYHLRVAGYKFGRIDNFLGSRKWSRFTLKEEPNTDRFLEAFHFLARLDSPKSDPQNEFDLDWEFVVRHFCEPPYFVVQPFSSGPELVENGEHSSCKEIVHQIRQKGITYPPLLKMLDKFEQVALELEVYE
ncbi:MAG: hypothetical protein F4Z01_07570 [Gammaproteobacteria bacterium]|nr:hypothetical protein [Gammaproteobacteria bacterium]MYF38922.1 hypothetical protein [Gammaproteobacteria bacterium]